MSTIEPLFVFHSSAQCDLLGPGPHRALLEEKILPGYILQCRWFGAKARHPRRFTIRDMVPVHPALDDARLAFVEAEYADESKEMWLLPLQVAAGKSAEDLIAAHPRAILARFADGVLFDGLYDAAFRAALLDLIAASGAHTGERGMVVAHPGPPLEEFDDVPPSRVLAVEQSNSSVIYGVQFFLKLYRRLEAGLNPDAEILRFLTRRGFVHSPPFAGSLEYRDGPGHACVLALATGLVANNGDAWSFTLRGLAQWFAALLGGGDAGQIEAESLARAAQLGTRTGELHLALASDPADPDFAPEPLTPADGGALIGSIAASARQVAGLIETRLATLPEIARDLALEYATSAGKLQMWLKDFAVPETAAKIRTHGDYHLGQVLETGGDFVIIDFEGEPLRPLSTRREKRSPFRDVAGMLRSFDYAAHAALDGHGQDREALAPHAAQWSAKAQRAFLDAWLAVTAGAVFRPATAVEENQLLEAFLLEKALYEVVYEINNRPTWLPIPLQGVLGLLAPL